MTSKDIEERFDFPYIVPREKVPRMVDILREYKGLAVSMYADCGDNRELTIAMERLEEAAQWAVKSILKDEEIDDYDEYILDQDII